MEAKLTVDSLLGQYAALGSLQHGIWLQLESPSSSAASHGIAAAASDQEFARGSNASCSPVSACQTWRCCNLAAVEGLHVCKAVPPLYRLCCCRGHGRLLLLAANLSQQVCCNMMMMQHGTQHA